MPRFRIACKANRRRLRCTGPVCAQMIPKEAKDKPNYYQKNKTKQNKTKQNKKQKTPPYVLTCEYPRDTISGL